MPDPKNDNRTIHVETEEQGAALMKLGMEHATLVGSLPETTPTENDDAQLPATTPTADRTSAS